MYVEMNYKLFNAKRPTGKLKAYVQTFSFFLIS